MLEQSVTERTKQLTETNTLLLKVQKENLQSQFEVLKQQVNPHFLFNSLNVLTSLIKIDPDLAESFTEQLSKVYRYVLENKEKDLVALSTELEFLNSYLFLLEIRFMNKLLIHIEIDKSYNDYQILPIAIQLIIENAIKHNVFSKTLPLKMDIFVDKEQRLNIVNNLNIRETKLVSTGVGLENIKRRYALVSEQKPEFFKTKDQFIARLPLLKSENE
ncbi:MAG: histidine kinase [Bacteroidales bacterium]|nr:histidine kinase [Bacteroidales bacterium]